MPLMKDRAQRVYKAGRQPSFKGNEIYHLGGNWRGGGRTEVEERRPRGEINGRG